MRRRALKRALVVVGCGVLTVAASACESTQRESARIGREGGRTLAGPAELKLGAVNHSVRVSKVTLLSSGGRTAVAARLTVTSSARAQRNVPVLVNVTGAGGKLLYTNQTGGLEASLQRIALLRPGQSAWWVNDQVLASGARDVKMRVGTGSKAPRGGSRGGAASASVTTKSVHVSEQSGISVLAGVLVNRSSKAQSRVPVFAVAVKPDGEAVAAGRAVVGALPGRVGASVPFQVFLVGNPAGAKLELTAMATAG